MATLSIEKNEDLVVRGDRIMLSLPNSSSTGLIKIVEDANLTAEMGEIVQLGSEVKNLPPTFEVGSKVLFRKYGGFFVNRKEYDQGTPCKDQSETYFVIIPTADLIAAVVPKDEPASGDILEKIDAATGYAHPSE